MKEAVVVRGAAARRDKASLKAVAQSQQATALLHAQQRAFYSQMQKTRLLYSPTQKRCPALAAALLGPLVLLVIWVR